MDKCVYRSTKGKVPPRYRHRIVNHRRLWGIWNGIKRRCLSPIEPRYKDYGGRGIIICDEWLNFDNFADWALSHGYSDNLTIERIDVNGNYCPENCTWITREAQRLNTRHNIRVEYNGKTWVLSELCKEYGVKYDTVHNRYVDCGWPIEKALFEKSKQVDSWESKCKAAGINPTTARDRIKKFGWTEEEALSVPSLGRKKRPPRKNTPTMRCH